MKEQNVQKRHKLITETFEKGAEHLLERRKNVPDYYYQPTAEQMDADEDKFRQMTNTVNFLKNARFKESKKVPRYTNAKRNVQFEENKPHYFVPSLKLLEFRNFELNKEYTQMVRFINRDKCLRRMKFIPPEHPEFKILEVNYPSKANTEVAAGNSIEFVIGFSSTELRDIDDRITIVSDEDNYDFQVVARPEKPIINLEAEFECRSCWYGQTTSSHLIIKNTGGYSRFDVKVEDKQNVAFKIDCGTFELQKNETKTIEVLFDPSSYGEHTADLICTDMYGRTSICTLRAEANVVEIIPYSYEGFRITKNLVHYFNELHFSDCVNGKRYTKTFEFVNGTKNTAEFEWSVRSNQPGIDCSITPNKSTFGGKSKSAFVVDLLVNSMPGTYTLELCQYLLDIPKTALLGSTAREDHVVKVLNHKITVVVELLQKPYSLSYQFYKPCIEFITNDLHTFEIDLYYESDTVDKLFVERLFTESDLEIELKEVRAAESEEPIIKEAKENWYNINGPNHYVLLFQFRSRKVMRCNAGFEVRLDHSHALKLDIDVCFTAPQLMFSQTIINLGFLPVYAECTLPLEIKNMAKNRENILILNRDTLGMAKFELQDLVIGKLDIPNLCLFNNDNQLKIHNPYINVGANKQRNCLATITSSEEGQLYKEILLETESYLRTQDLSSNDAEIFYPKPLQRVKIVGQFEKPELVMNRYVFNFDRLCVEKKYYIKNSTDPKILYLRNTNNFSLRWKIKCLDPAASELMDCNFYPKEGVLDPLQSIKIKTKLSIFKISSFSTKFKVSYKPVGILSSSEDKNSARTLALSEGTDRGSIASAGINLSTIKSNYLVFEYNFIDVRGIEVNFEVTENQQTTPLRSVKVESTIMEAIIKRFAITNMSDLSVNFNFTTNKVPCEEMQYQINETMKTENDDTIRRGSFRMKNQSNNSIRSKTGGSFTKTSIFTTAMVPPKPLNIKHGKQFNFKNKNAQELQNVTYYNSICQKILDRMGSDSIIGISPKEGVLKANERLDITLIMYADAPAEYNDELVFETSNGFERRIDMRLNFLGMPIALSENQVGLKNLDRNNFVLNFGDVVACDNPKSKMLKVINRSSKTIKVYLWVFEILAEELNAGVKGDELNTKIDEDVEGENQAEKEAYANTQNTTNHEIAKDTMDEPKIDVEGVEPVDQGQKHVTIPAPKIVERNCGMLNCDITKSGAGNFKINKTILMIPPDSTMPIQITFDPFHHFGFRGIEEKVLILQNEDKVDKNSDKITIKLEANKINPLIEFLGDNNFQKDLVTFYKFPSKNTNKFNLSLSECNDIVVKNLSTSKIGFLGELQGPFKFHNSNTNTKIFELKAAEVLEIKVRFEGFHHKDYVSWPKSPSVFVQGHFVVNYAHYYKSIAEQSKSDSYPENQRLELEGVLLRPQLALALTKHLYHTTTSDQLEIDFGTVHFANRKTVALFLLNVSKVDAKFRISRLNKGGRQAIGYFTQTLGERENAEGLSDENVFTFDCVEGQVDADATYFTNAPENIDFVSNPSASKIIKIVFHPNKDDKLYKSHFEVACKHGTSIRFSVKGHSTTDEKFFDKHSM